ncbi:aspartate carbamoyltransferase catalytic subunit [Pelagicoccus sp. SDUM812003]|uniref:aspartate carbamoyltransferase catalytic subunit n=1 Tax=Pelagicoccus sp. SDUM812003 TaxID=3041267 RepID=UPI00280D70A1|nr:aspartate carbamoyltransferase catalytic subunit [Pelagicoccus sp. SDUM812003]MDQ8201850.1 aspartate carbamoyltransferase catalytic subunit [Pelagicoccus sp. SDUM812003]
MPWNRKDLITIEELSVDEINTLFETADAFKKVLGRKTAKTPALRGKHVVNLFFEPSTRTRVAFEMAAKRLSADVTSLDMKTSSATKGETLRDTVENIRALAADIIIIRHSAPGSAGYIAKILDIPVLNAGDGAHEHPTQALLDCFTLREKFGSLEGRKIAILGDILYSRVARSNIWAMKKLGAEVTLVGPSTLVPHEFEQFGVHVSHNLKSALADKDAVMLLRIQHERQNASAFPSLNEYTSMFGLNKERLAWLKKDAIIMHPGPINRGVEIDSELADSEQSVILEQVTNGLAVRMAGLYLCNGGSAEAVVTK